MKHLKTNFKPARSFMTLLAIICSALAWADNVSEDQAMQLAQSFVNHHKTTATSPRRAPGTTQELTPAAQICGLYVFNVANDGGFVIVSNDVRTTPILGFSDSGSLDTDNIPSNMRAWLQGYADEIAWLQKQSTVSASTRADAPHRIPEAKNAVYPLLRTTWNQGSPYNNLCPTLSQTENCATGCVATAMAQVMKYHQWPEEATAEIPSYNGRESLESTTFDWNNMKEEYSSYTEAQATAVATLMKYCGWSVQMQYGPESEASNTMVAYALKEYFGYNETTEYVNRSLYTSDKWIDLIYYEISHQRPVVYGGQSSGGGHAFVCDGYQYTDNNHYFHINWGWGGLSDHYFLLSALNPYEQGTGGSTTSDGFNRGQEAVIGIQSSIDTGTMSGIEKNDIDLTLNSMTLSNSAITLGSTVNITLNITNNSKDDFEGSVAVGYKENDNSFPLVADGDFIIPSKETINCVITFTPGNVGDYPLVFYFPDPRGEYPYVTDCEIKATLKVLPTKSPTDLTATETGARSTVLSWTENGNATEWVVAYKAVGDNNFTTVTASTNPFTLSGLEPETEYTVKVRPANEQNSWSAEITFTTGETCPVPQNLTVANVTHNAAMARWEGKADSYDVRYGIVPENFISTEATWLQYENFTSGSFKRWGSGQVEEATWGVMYPGNLVTGNLLTKVSFFEYNKNTGDITVNIYLGGDTAPGELLHTKVVTPTGQTAFHEVTFENPVSIIPGMNLWIVLTEVGDYPILSVPCTEPNNTWIYNGNSWKTADKVGINGYGWMIRGYMESESLNLDDITWTETTSTERSCQMTNLETDTQYVVQVKGNYVGEGSSLWETLIFTTLENVTLADAATDNSKTVEANEGKTISVTLADRTLYKDGAWNTICLPFNLTLQGSPLEGAIAKTLTDATMTGTHVSLNFGEAVDELEAGIPYIIKWNNTEGTEENIVNPVFPGVTIVNSSKEERTITMADSNVKFIGYHDAFNIDETDTDIYYMTADNTLKHTGKARTLLACRAYFQFSEAATARKITLDFGDMTTEIGHTEITERTSDWYTIDGVKHGKQPSHKGIYIKDGKKVVIR